MRDRMPTVRAVSALRSVSMVRAKVGDIQCTGGAAGPKK